MMIRSRSLSCFETYPNAGRFVEVLFVWWGTLGNPPTACVMVLDRSHKEWHSVLLLHVTNSVLTCLLVLLPQSKYGTTVAQVELANQLCWVVIIHNLLVNQSHQSLLPTYRRRCCRHRTVNKLTLLSVSIYYSTTPVPSTTSVVSRPLLAFIYLTLYVLIIHQRRTHPPIAEARPVAGAPKAC
jgi:hypothetical protein